MCALATFWVGKGGLAAVEAGKAARGPETPP